MESPEEIAALHDALSVTESKRYFHLGSETCEQNLSQGSGETLMKAAMQL